MRFQKPTLQRTFWKASVYISIFDRFSEDATGENASKNILFHTDAGSCCRGLSQWAHDSRRPDDANVAPHGGIYKHVAGQHSPVYICDTDVGSRWLLRSPVAVDGVLSVNTKKENTS